jgi:predicted amidophosphoribosyltransferase
VVHGIKKDKSLTYGFDVVVRGKTVGICSGQEDMAIVWAADNLADEIVKLYPQRPLVIVPIPGHADTSASLVESGRLHLLAESIALSLAERHGVDAIAGAAIHLAQVMPSAHGGGTRDPSVIQANLRSLPASAFTGRVAILIDDVVTSGAHLIAASNVMVANGYLVGEVTFAVARTVHARGQPFATLLEDLPR